MIRNIVKIDEEKCNGCGLCVPACAEGAIQIINGKAKLVADNLCDGLGACLGDCPQDAITIEQRDASEFDEQAVATSQQSVKVPVHGGGCPSAQAQKLSPPTKSVIAETETGPSQLGNWPVQLKLVPPTAPFLAEADLLLAADCVPFAYPDFHQKYLAGKTLLIGCPKLDDVEAYVEKLTAILSQNDIKSLTVLHMEVPCCTGLLSLARQALAASGKEIPFESVIIGIKGDVK
ncbi:MAG: 4Fe-4S ferredoxin [Desulfuromonadales bacterium C00003094]|nr:MAG: 4Fe-4S ferredoxin [Desulfuromonadales bacterium C00003094]